MWLDYLYIPIYNTIKKRQTSTSEVQDMTKTEQKKLAQDLIMDQIAIIGYGERYEEYKKQVGEDADAVLQAQMDRVAKMFGFKEAWFA